MIGKKPRDNQDSLKVDIKTHPGYKDSNAVYIYVPLFRTVGPEALLKFITLPVKKSSRGEIFPQGPIIMV